MKIKLLKEPATHLAEKYGCPYDDFCNEAVIDTDKNDITFVWFDYEGQSMFNKSYPLHSDDGLIIRDAAYYDNFSLQSLL